MNQPQPLRFHLNSTTNTVVDELTGERFQFDTFEQAYFARGQKELASRPAAVTSAKKQRRLEQIAERRQAGR